MSWVNYLTSKNHIHAIFGDNFPSLNNIELHEIILDRDGPTVKIRFDVADFPDKPPKKWVVSKFNRVQITLACLNVEEFEIIGWARNCKCNIEVISINDFISVVIDSKTKLKMLVEHLYIDKISAYQSVDI